MNFSWWNGLRKDSLFYKACLVRVHRKCILFAYTDWKCNCFNMGWELSNSKPVKITIDKRQQITLVTSTSAKKWCTSSPHPYFYQSNNHEKPGWLKVHEITYDASWQHLTMVFVWPQIISLTHRRHIIRYSFDETTGGCGQFFSGLASEAGSPRPPLRWWLLLLN